MCQALEDLPSEYGAYKFVSNYGLKPVLSGESFCRIRMPWEGGKIGVRRRQFIEFVTGIVVSLVGIRLRAMEDACASESQKRERVMKPSWKRVKNPIIPGFASDPAICRRGDEFFIVTSSFQWWPALPIYRSRDLRNWELIGYAITDPSYANLSRIGDSAGIWAPSLTYHDGLFWLVYCIASGSRQHGYECMNFLITAKEPTGPWSEPVHLNSSGNDPSLFHDDDGRKYVLCTDFRISPGIPAHAGVLLQEYSHKERRLIGSAKNIWTGTELGIPEGAKMFKRRGIYYLMIAEGGTGYGHAVTMARSRSIWGPYEPHPENPILTARDDPKNPIQRAGHADMLDLGDGRVALVYLASRPINRRSMLGRETFLASARWCEDGWLRLDSRKPIFELPDFGLPESSFEEPPFRDDFDAPNLQLEWNTLRQPMDDLFDLKSRPSWLVLTPTASFLSSIERPCLIARRVRHHIFTAKTLMEFEPNAPEQFAGLVCYYDTRRWYFLLRLLDVRLGNAIALWAKGASVKPKELAIEPVKRGPLLLRVDCDGHHLQFYYAPSNAQEWRQIGEPQDALMLSDEYVEEVDKPPTFGFTGAFVGLYCYARDKDAPKAAFDWFEYQGEEMEFGR